MKKWRRGDLRLLHSVSSQICEDRIVTWCIYHYYPVSKWKKLAICWRLIFRVLVYIFLWLIKATCIVWYFELMLDLLYNTLSVFLVLRFSLQGCCSFKSIWDVIPCWWVNVYQHLKILWCLQLQDQAVQGMLDPENNIQRMWVFISSALCYNIHILKS
jgi:hypothetical protein